MTSEQITSLIRVGIALLTGLGSILLLQRVLRGVEKRARTALPGENRLKRTLTVLHAARSLGYALILLVVGLMILNELGINIAPVLASAGVAGLALSLGAQTVIKDFLGGLFILAENQFDVGDTITVGEVTGVVEQISLRLTSLRDAEGRLHLAPNGDIRMVSNLTASWARVVITLNLDYEADLEQAAQALQAAIRRVQADAEVAPDLLEPPQVLSGAGFSDWAVQSQVVAKTRPGKQWQVGRALRQAALLELKAHGVRVAVPVQRVENLPERA